LANIFAYFHEFHTRPTFTRDWIKKVEYNCIAQGDSNTIEDLDIKPSFLEDKIGFVGAKWKRGGGFLDIHFKARD